MTSIIISKALWISAAAASSLISLFFNFPRFLHTNPTWCTHYWTACYLRLLNSDISTQWPEPCQVDFRSQKYTPKSQHRLCQTMNRFGVLTCAPRLHNAQCTILTSSNTFDAHQRESATMIKQPPLKMTNLVGAIAELLTAPTNSPAPYPRLWLWTEFSVASSLSILSLAQCWKGWFLSPITRPFGDGEGGYSPRRMENGRRTWSSDEE